MFEKKDIIFSETLGVCQVAELTKLSAKNGEQVLYYGLRSVADKKKVSYIPVNNHQVNLRELFTEDEAQTLLGSPELEKNEILKAAVNYVLQKGDSDVTTITGN